MSTDPFRKRYANLDALRALAALAVMVEHMFGDLLRQAPAGAGPISNLVQSVVQNVSLGRFGVVLFFLISGFVVPFSLGGERPLRHFAISRLFRLYPALWLALLTIATMGWLSGEAPPMATVLANLTMAAPLLRQPWLSPIHWTLFVELLFYGLVAVLFVAGGLRHVGALLALSLVLIAATVLPVQLRMQGVVSLPVQYLGMHLSFLLLGLLLRLWLVELMRGAGLATFCLALAQGAALLSVSEFSLARRDNFVMEGLSPVLSACALAVAVCFAAVRLGRPRSVALARAGLISYSMYLFHGPVNALIYRVLPLTGQAGDVATMLICIVATMLVSWFVYRTVERPMIRLGRSLSGQRGAQAASTLPRAELSEPAEGGSPSGADRLAVEAPAFRATDGRGAGRRESLRLQREPTSPRSEGTAEAGPNARVRDRLAGLIVGTAVAGITMSWLAMLGYVGWKLAGLL